MELVLIFLLIEVIHGNSNFQANIVGGALARINEYPHSAFLGVTCDSVDSSDTEYWSCGGSILNQRIIITAAHCLYGCRESSYITVNVGDSNKNHGAATLSKRFVVHESYTEQSVINDLGLIFLRRDIKFGPNVKRIILMAKPPLNEAVQVAGWGKIDEKSTPTVSLKVARQFLLGTKQCIEILKSKPKHTICAQPQEAANGYVARGDSGSALLVRKSIQVGVVSYRNPLQAPSIGVYTYLPHFLEWIHRMAKMMYAATKTVKLKKKENSNKKFL